MQKKRFRIIPDSARNGRRSSSLAAGTRRPLPVAGHPIAGRGIPRGRCGAISLACASLLILFPALRAADWPAWRYDAARSASSPEELPSDLRLHWVRDLGTPRPAWPESQEKLRFDQSYEPVVAQGMVFVPSMVSDRVTAYEAATGRERWRFYAGGPVRFAPVYHDGRVFAVSDDGFLYALRASDGTLLWRIAGGPERDWLLGNDRMISMWPARGAPVVADGTLYFGASIWPFMGIFIHAVDPASGKTIWSNSGLGAMYMLQQHSSPAFAGVAPQGYFAAAGDTLLVAGGRTVPAALDRRTGKFRYLHLAERTFGKDAGGYGVWMRGDYFHVRGTAYDLRTGKGVLRTLPGIVTEQGIYSIEDGALVLAGWPPIEILELDRRGRPQTRRLLRRLATFALRLAPDKLFFRAGNRLYGARNDGTLLAIDLDSEPEPRISWQARIEGTPWTLLAADGRLFAVTREGQLYAFGEEPVEPVRHARTTSALPEPSEEETVHPRPVLERARPRAGFALVLGTRDGQLVTNLLRQTSLHVVVVEPDPVRAATLRRRLDEAGMYGWRAAVIQEALGSIRLPPYFASLVTTELRWDALSERSTGNLSRLLNCLRPYGGTAVLPGAAGAASRLAGAIEGARVDAVGDDLVVIRPAGLPDAGTWTHQYADAANSVVSRDARVKAPLGLLWFGGPSNDAILPRHGHGPTPQVVGGRLFIEGRNMLRSVDVYTGRLLWETSIPDFGRFYDNTAHQPGANETGSNYVSLADTIYAITPRTCLLLDPVDGKIRERFSLAPATPGGIPPKWGFVTTLGDALVAGVSPVAISEKKASRVLVGNAEAARTLVPRRAVWRYLAGSHPENGWTEPDYDDRDWPEGEAGFGYGDEDDRTVLADMRGTYTTVYIRRRFQYTGDVPPRFLLLRIAYDDAFIAYLNGKEILRQGVGTGTGPAAGNITPHEAGTVEDFDLANAIALLRKGPNVLALEGHNRSPESSDFSLDPFLVHVPGEGEVKLVPLTEAPEVEMNVEYASSSRELVVMDRHTGAVRWRRTAATNFRHNAIVAGAGKVFCVDGLSPSKRQLLRRRGVEVPASGTLYALDAGTGRVVWRTSEDVFGTWLAYSEEHDVLLQAGSAARDRAGDEVLTGMVVYRAADGEVIWKDLRRSYTGPPLLHRGTIITQTSALDLLTGKEKTRRHPVSDAPLPWRFSRNYGCNTIIASEHLLTFRSAAAGYWDLNTDAGTGNLGGFKSGCTSNLIAADGVLNAPDYTRTCVCSYQNQTSLALVHRPSVESWTFIQLPDAGLSRLRRLGLNLGAPGDHYADSGTLWFEYPVVGGPGPELPVEAEGPGLRWVRQHASLMRDGPLRWVGASGALGIRSLKLTTPDLRGRRFTVRLLFAELEDAAPGERVFAVSLQGKRRLARLDVVAEAGGARVVLAKRFPGVRGDGQGLRVDLSPAPGAAYGPVLCGVELLAED